MAGADRQNQSRSGAGQGAVAQITWSPSGAQLTDLVLSAEDRAVTGAIRDSAKARIDCPSAGRCRSSTSSSPTRARHLVPPTEVVGKEWRPRLAYRVTTRPFARPPGCDRSASPPTGSAHRFENDCRRLGDALDAVVAALTAHAASLSLATSPGLGQAAAATTGRLDRPTHLRADRTSAFRRGAPYRPRQAHPASGVLVAS